MSEMKRAENAKDSEKAVSIFKRCNDVTKLLNKIKKEKEANYK